MLYIKIIFYTITFYFIVHLNVNKINLSLHSVDNFTYMLWFKMLILSPRHKFILTQYPYGRDVIYGWPLKQKRWGSSVATITDVIDLINLLKNESEMFSAMVFVLFLVKAVQNLISTFLNIMFCIYNLSPTSQTI